MCLLPFPVPASLLGLQEHGPSAHYVVQSNASEIYDQTGSLLQGWPLNEGTWGKRQPRLSFGLTKGNY